MPRTSAFDPSSPGGDPVGSETLVERRQLTIFFCDLLDSTEIAQRLDLEDLRSVIQAYHSLCADVLGRFGGHTAQYLGDGLLVYFGYPMADGRDALHAVRAGLAIVQRLRRLNERLEHDPGVHLSARVAIHTGPVVIGRVGSGARSDVLALGEAVNIAARLQGLAGAGSVVISEDTLRLVQGRFVCESLGRVALRGVRDPVTAYRVIQGGGAASGFDASPAQGWTPLTDREVELEMLRQRWSLAAAGKGQTVVLRGEPGVGKSRLAKELRDHLCGEPHTWLECRGAPDTHGTPYHPVIELLESAIGLRPEDDPEARYLRLHEVLSLYDLDPDRNTPRIAALFGARRPRGEPTIGETAPERLRELLCTWLLELARRQPVLLLVDDVHWLDPSSLALLHELVPHVAASAVLLLVIERSDETHAVWPAGAPVTTLRVGALAPEAAAALAVAAAAAPLPLREARRIAEQAAGIPLFVEEIARAWDPAEGGVPGERSPVPPRSPTLDPGAHLARVPARLEAPLRAQLDRLEDALPAAQACAVLGDGFSHGLASALLAPHVRSGPDALGTLVARDILRRSGSGPRASYRFRNPLLRAVAYRSLLRADRRALHRTVCARLESPTETDSTVRPERIALHYEGADECAPAIAAWQRAADRCLAQGAPREAIGHLQRALALVDRLPAGRPRLDTELRLELSLAIPLQTVFGYGSARAERSFRRARELGQQLGDPRALFSTLAGLSAYHLLRADLRTALGVADQALRIAEQQRDRGLVLWARFGLGLVSLYLGDLETARGIYDAGLAFATEPGAAELRRAYAGDPAVDCRTQSALALCLLGDAPGAEERVGEALRLAGDPAPAPVRASALATASVIAQIGGDLVRAGQRSAQAIELASDAGLPLWQGLGEAVHGFVQVRSGEHDRGIDQIRAGADRMHDTGARLGQTYLRTLLAHAHLLAGHLREALDAAEAGLAAVEDHDERHCEAELWRLQGEVFAATESRAAARCFDRALAVAQRQGARAWEERIRHSHQRLSLAGPGPVPSAG